jgi:hypothetical protein
MNPEKEPNGMFLYSRPSMAPKRPERDELGCAQKKANRAEGAVRATIRWFTKARV